MKPSLNKLQKFFKLEADRGYDNRAVHGGLERILEIWEDEARSERISEDLIRAISARLTDYSRLSPASRAEALGGLKRRIHREIGAPPIPSPLSEKGKTDKEAITSKDKLAPSKTHSTQQSVTPLSPRTTPQTTRQKPVVEPEPSPAPDEPPAALNASVTVLPGVGTRHAQTLSRLGLNTLGDMLYYFPRRYDDYSQLKPINRLEYGEEVTVIGTVQSITKRSVRGGRTQLVEAIVSDGTSALKVTWFNQPWVAKRLRNRSQISLSGKIDQYLGRMVMNSPEWEPLEQQQLNTNRIVPVYPLTAKITQRWLRRLMSKVITHWAPRTSDPLPEKVRLSAGLVDLHTALLQAHFPDSWKQLKNARHRLAFDEILLLQLGVLRQKRVWRERIGRLFETPEEWIKAQGKRLPFRLTDAQQRSLQDIRDDLASGRPMTRLLQGDVGSGKTVVAALAAAMVTRRGSQVAMMAPTSILAEQHFASMQKILDSGKKIRLMIGATPESEKREIREGLENGSIKFVIGTHALIEGPVTFADLQLIIVDEQHRFGVKQRATLRSKGTNPHLLVMTATPIPRSLALTVYGDLDLSVMDEMPPGRQAVSTYVLTPRERERAYSLIRSQVEKGRQIFIIYPLVEESDKSDTKAAVEEHSRLQSEVFPKFRIGLLHGRLKPQEKEDVMANFHAGEYHILVSTSVVEVGVDVPNATVMLIEGANRFGLAQLHQFRGRVGRGGDKAFCLLIPETPDSVENERLQVMTQTNDGFVLAERDLEQRGPGEFLGTRQSGYTGLRLANLTDVHLIEKARRQAKLLFEQDPELSQPEHELLAKTLQRAWGDGNQSTNGDIS